jgi:hypothetical protein
MKPLLEDRTPKQLLWIIAASNVLTSLGFAIPAVQSWQLPNHRTPFLQEIPWILAILTGLIASLLAELSLRDGVNSDQWPDTLLAGPKKLFARPVISALSWSLIAASFCVIAFSRNSNGAAYWVFLAPAMSLTRVRYSLSPPKKPEIDFRLGAPAKPIQSEHWGTPPLPSSD